MKKILLIITIAVFFYSSIDAQVYASEELRLQEEKHILEKNQRLGISNSVVNETEEILKQALPANVLLNTYKLVSLEAIDYSKKHTDAEMKAFQAEMLSEFQTNDIRISQDYSMFYLINKADNTKYSAIEIRKEENKLVYINCEKCNMEPMTILVNNNNELIVETPAQDSGSFYTVRFTLKK